MISDWKDSGKGNRISPKFELWQTPRIPKNGLWTKESVGMEEKRSLQFAPVWAFVWKRLEQGGNRKIEKKEITNPNSKVVLKLRCNPLRSHWTEEEQESTSLKKFLFSLHIAKRFVDKNWILRGESKSIPSHQDLRAASKRVPISRKAPNLHRSLPGMKKKKEKCSAKRLSVPLKLLRETGQHQRRLLKNKIGTKLSRRCSQRWNSSWLRTRLHQSNSKQTWTSESNWIWSQLAVAVEVVAPSSSLSSFA